MKILVIEDEKLLADSIKTLFEALDQNKKKAV